MVLYWLYFPAETTEDKKNFVQALVLSVGAVVGIGTLAVGWQNLRQSQRNTQETLLNAREVEERRAQETALQAYFERMGELLTKEGLRVCPDQRPSQEYWDKKHDDVRLSARAQTLTVLLGLDGKRKRALVTFLLETSLIQRYDTVVGLHDADLSDADLQGASLWCVNLSRVNMESADLRAADLRGVDLRNADLNKTKLKGAKLEAFTSASDYAKEVAKVLPETCFPIYTDLRGTKLRGATGLTQEQIEQAIGDKTTELPEDLERPKTWPQGEGEQIVENECGFARFRE